MTQARRHAAEPEGRREDRAGRRLRGVELALDHLVANGRPARLAPQLHLQPEGVKQPELVRHDERRAIAQRHEADPERAAVAQRGRLAFGESEWTCSPAH